MDYESFLAENVFGEEFCNSDSSSSNLAFASLLRDIDTQSAELKGPISPHGGFGGFIEPQLGGFDASFKTRSLCRHFIKGFCLRGESCNFVHDLSLFCPDEQKVFLGGLPLWLTPVMLRKKLNELRVNILNNPKVLRGFCPEICLGSVQEAMELIARQWIWIGDRRVDVRPYQSNYQLRDSIPHAARRSVFLGGLPENTTGDMITKDLWHLGVRVTEYPVVKKGYAPCVVLGSSKQAKLLVSLGRIVINGSVVDVRPYMIFKRCH